MQSPSIQNGARIAENLPKRTCSRTGRKLKFAAKMKRTCHVIYARLCVNVEIITPPPLPPPLKKKQIGAALALCHND